MTPYYENKGVKIYHGDCLEILPDLEDFDMCFTDPPYGVGYDGGYRKGKTGKYKEILVGDEENNDIYSKIIPIILKKVNGPCYSWCGIEKLDFALVPIRKLGTIHAVIIWHKTNAQYAAMGKKYKLRTETCVFFKNKKSTLRWIGSSKESNLWEMRKDPRNTFHPTQKPVELAERAINNHAIETIVDPFCGGGSTLVAAKRKGKKCVGIEIEEKYCEVSAKRVDQELDFYSGD